MMETAAPAQWPEGPCAYSYWKGGRPRPDLVCPNETDFAVKIPDGRGDDWRKAQLACLEHLHDVIWQMQAGHHYQGVYLLAAKPQPWN